MRTRDYHVMTNYEIEQYLNRNDVIFVPIGNAECHGPWPVDCEYVVAEAWARLFAEKFDGLFLKNLIYLPAGGTAAMRGTVQMGEFDAMHYMYAISRSLLKQGFRRQVFQIDDAGSLAFGKASAKEVGVQPVRAAALKEFKNYRKSFSIIPDKSIVAK